jgi:hypothetical protein
MFRMWEKPDKPRIKAGMAHKSVPDKRRWERDDVHDSIDYSDAPVPEIPEEFLVEVKSKT